MKNYLVVSHNNARAPDVDDDGDDADDDVDENGDEEVPPLVGRCAFMNKHTLFGGGGTANSCTALHSRNQNQEGWVRGDGEGENMDCSLPGALLVGSGGCYKAIHFSLLVLFFPCSACIVSAASNSQAGATEECRIFLGCWFAPAGRNEIVDG